MVAAQKLESNLIYNLQRDGHIRNVGVSEFMEQMKEFVLENANVAGTFIRCILLSLISCVTTKSYRDAIIVGRYLLENFNADTIESFNRIIAQYLNRRDRTEESDIIDVQHMGILARIMRDVSGVVDSKLSVEQENLLRFCYAMRATLSQNLKIDSNLCYLRLLYESSEIINSTENVISIDVDPLSDKFFETVNQLYRQESDSNKESKDKLIHVLRVISITPSPKYEYICDELRGVIESSQETSELRSWQCIAYSSMNDDLSKHMQDGLTLLITSITESEFKQDHLIGLFGYLYSLSKSKQLYANIFSLLESTWIHRFCSAMNVEVGTYCLSSVLNIVDNMILHHSQSVTSEQKIKLPSVLLEVMSKSTHTAHHAIALKIMNNIPLDDNSVKQACEMAMSIGPDAQLATRVLDTVMNVSAHYQVIREFAQPLASACLNAVLSDRSPEALSLLIKLIQQSNQHDNNNLDCSHDNLIVQFYNVIVAEERARDEGLPSLPVEQLISIWKHRDAVHKSLNSLRIGSDLFLRIFIILNEKNWYDHELSEKVIDAVNQVTTQDSYLVRPKRVRRKSKMTSSSTSFGQMEMDNQQKRESEMIHQQESKSNDLMDYWITRGFYIARSDSSPVDFVQEALNKSRGMEYSDHSNAIKSQFKLDASDHVEQSKDEDDLVLSSMDSQEDFMDDDQIGDGMDDEEFDSATISTPAPTIAPPSNKNTKKTPESAENIYRLVMDDSMGETDVYAKLTGEKIHSDDSIYCNEWFANGPQNEYIGARKVLACLIGMVALENNHDFDSNISNDKLLTAIYHTCAAFQFASFRVNLLCLSLMVAMPIEIEHLQIMSQILLQMNTVIRQRFTIGSNLYLSTLEITFLNFYTHQWLKLLNQIRMVPIVDDDEKTIKNARIYMLRRVLPVPDFDVMIRAVVHLSLIEREDAGRDVESTIMFGSDSRQVRSILSDERLKSIAHSKPSDLEQIIQNYILIVSECAAMEQSRLYLAVDFINRLACDFENVDDVMFKKILDAHAMLCERNDLEKLLNKSIVFYARGVGVDDKGGPQVMCVDGEGEVTVCDVSEEDLFLLSNQRSVPRKSRVVDQHVVVGDCIKIDNVHFCIE
ncbi:hypothetical protein AKO1_005327 [Acrasis kona]|uniref:Uncharacterized protein n=1 Tax=Acrasis kona TaxID=1008807 RepID=A0AAW2YLC3_9EUKA